VRFGDSRFDQRTSVIDDPRVERQFAPEESSRIMRPNLVASILVSTLSCGFASDAEPTVIVSGERSQNNLVSAVELVNT
jgi:hypothetical protein